MSFLEYPEIKDYFESDDRAFDIAEDNSFSIRDKSNERITEIEFINRLRNIIKAEWKKLGGGVFIGTENQKDIMLFSYKERENNYPIECKVVFSCGNIRMIYDAEEVYDDEDYLVSSHTIVESNDFYCYDESCLAGIFCYAKTPSEILQCVIRRYDYFYTEKHYIPLYHALSYNQFDTARYLLDLGAKQNYREMLHINPLISCYSMGAFDLVRLLMQYKPYFNNVLDLHLLTSRSTNPISRELDQLSLNYMKQSEICIETSARTVSKLLEEDRDNLIDYFLPKKVTKKYIDLIFYYFYPSLFYYFLLLVFFLCFFLGFF